MSPETDDAEFASAAEVVHQLISDVESMLGEEDRQLFEFLRETIFVEDDSEISDSEMLVHVRRLARNRIQSSEDIAR